MDIIDTNIQILSLKTGVPDDQLRMLTAFVVCAIFGFFHRSLIRGRQLRMYSGATLGVLLTYFVYREAILNILLQTFIVYFMVKHLGKKAPMLVFAETIVYVAIHHIYRQYVDYGGWRLDVTTNLMINTIKWTSFAFCVRDGLMAETTLTAEQKQRRLTKLPSLGDYFAYIFFYAGCLAGPAYDYYEFDLFVSEKEEYKNIPSTVWETLRLFRNAIICFGIFQGLGPFLQCQFVGSEEFGNMNFLLQTLWLNVMMVVQRTKYYGGFLFTEFSIASGGITYSGSGQWQRIKSIDLDWDLQHNMKDKVDKWNIMVQTWLRRYVYCRIYSEEEIKQSASKQNIAFQLTFAVSAIWHGFYPGYYLSFLQWGILNNVNKAIFKASINTTVFKAFETNKILQLIRWYISSTIFNVFGTSFMLLSIDKILAFYNNMLWIPNVLLVSLLVFFMVTQFGQRKAKLA